MFACHRPLNDRVARKTLVTSYPASYLVSRVSVTLAQSSAILRCHVLNDNVFVLTLSHTRMRMIEYRTHTVYICSYHHLSRAPGQRK